MGRGSLRFSPEDRRTKGIRGDFFGALHVFGIEFVGAFYVFGIKNVIFLHVFPIYDVTEKAYAGHKTPVFVGIFSSSPNSP